MRLYTIIQSPFSFNEEPLFTLRDYIKSQRLWPGQQISLGIITDNGLAETRTIWIGHATPSQGLQNRTVTDITKWSEEILLLFVIKIYQHNFQCC